MSELLVLIEWTGYEEMEVRGVSDSRAILRAVASESVPGEFWNDDNDYWKNFRIEKAPHFTEWPEFLGNRHLFEKEEA